MKIIFFIGSYLLSFIFISSEGFAEKFSSFVKGKKFLLIYKDNIAFARYSKINNNYQNVNINNTNLNVELNAIKNEQKQNIPNNQQNQNQQNTNQQNTNQIPLSNTYLKYEYKQLEDGIFELENGAIISVKDGKIEIIKNKQFKAFDLFFQEKKSICNDIKFDFIYKHFILKEKIFGYCYQIYVPYYFDSVFLILFYSKEQDKIYHLITSLNQDFSCFYNKKFYDYTIIKDFSENNKKKIQEIKTEKTRKENIKKTTYIPKIIIDKKFQENLEQERRFKIAFRSLSSNYEILREDDKKKDILDDENTFDSETLINYYSNNKNKFPILKRNNIINIEDCQKMQITQDVINKFQWFNIK